jgi:hypothetical protein
MNGKGSLAVSILLTVLSLLIGLVAIAVLIGVGEAANNSIAAFAAVSFPLALLAALFSWITPPARWAVAAALSAPVVVVAVLGSWSSSLLTLGALWTAALVFLGAYVGARIRMSRASTQQVPPS